MDPLVSITIKTFNSSRFIIETIESVLNQTYKNIEIVVADDGSTDETPNILREFEKKYPGIIHVQYNPVNQGITKNCNSIHKRYKGKYIAHLGGDDIMLPTKLEEQVAFMEANPNCSISYHNMIVFDSDTNNVLKYRNEKKRVKKDGDVRLLIKEGPINGASSTMVRAEKMPSAYDERLIVASDWFYFIQVLMNGGEIKYIDKILGKYRRHKNNVTSKTGKFFNQQNIDHLNTCAIIMTEYPQYAYEANSRMKEVLFQYRVRYPNYYLMFTKLSINNFKIKAILYYVIHLITLGKFAK